MSVCNYETVCIYFHVCNYVTVYLTKQSADLAVQLDLPTLGPGDRWHSGTGDLAMKAVRQWGCQTVRYLDLQIVTL